MIARFVAVLAAFVFAGTTPALAGSESAATDFSTAVSDAQIFSNANGPALGDADVQFRELFTTWKSMDKRSTGQLSIPSMTPVKSYRLTSQYGYRSDPFKGRRANHQGLDMAGPVGTPIYATADGIVGRSQWLGGYGNYIEINHGGEIQTRYGHMSKLLVNSNERVKRGQLIGLMGSTGRSTGSHLHYEVRISGEPVNPLTFMQSDSYLLAMQERGEAPEALGGPED